MYATRALHMRTHRRVRETVSRQITRLTEGATAVFAFERFLASVYALQKSHIAPFPHTVE
jgi:hypothetical protein